MPRHARWCIAGVPLHVVHRGHNRSACFASPREYELYLGLLQEMSELHRCSIHAFVLMTNHVHLVVTPEDRDGISRFMKKVAQRYTQFVNRTHARTGALWEGRFKSSLIDSEQYLLRCHRYVELNPVRAGMVANPAQYRWSSYMHNAMGSPSPIVRPHGIYAALGRTHEARQARYRALFEFEVSKAELTQIRRATLSGDPLGTAEFVARIERMLGAR